MEYLLQYSETLDISRYFYIPIDKVKRQNTGNLRKC